MLLELRKSKKSMQRFHRGRRLPKTRIKTRPVEKKCVECVSFFFITWTPFSIFNMINAMGHIPPDSKSIILLKSTGAQSGVLSHCYFTNFKI